MSIPRFASCTSARLPLERIRTSLPFDARTVRLPAGVRPLAPFPLLKPDDALLGRPLLPPLWPPRADPATCPPAAPVEGTCPPPVAFVAPLRPPPAIFG